MATIKDVAAVAGVTVTTVSRVLNNRGYISDKTRKKVYNAMAELDYRPNEVARSLIRKKSNLIGLIVPDVAHPFFSELTSHIEYFAYKAGYKILLCDSYQESYKEKDYIAMLRSNQVDGIIMASHTLEVDEYMNLNLPVVAVDRTFSETIPYITSDNYSGGVQATNLLIDKGCKKIAHISGPLILNTPANNRYKAFTDVAEQKNIESVLIETELGLHQDYERIIHKLFQDHPDVDGIFASSDMIAIAAIKVANEIGKRIPGDLKIVGFDDISFASMIVPSLTTIKQSTEMMGKMTIQLLADQIDGKEVAIENIIPIELKERKTT